jgi:PKD repeat protein
MARRPNPVALLLAALLAPGAAAQADFTASVTSGPIPLTVQFEDITPGATQPALWTFGQGPLPIGQGQAVEFTYTLPGTYDVAMTTYTGNPPVPTQVVKRGFIQVDTVPLDAAFDWDVSVGGAPLAVQFTDTTAGAVPTAWLWDFGDGSSSTEQHPLHVYTQPGAYAVQLEATFHGISDVKTAPAAVSVGSVMRLADPVIQTVGTVGRHLLTPDLDGDGLPDLLSATLQTNALGTKRFITRLNSGSGIYGTTTITPLDGQPWFWDTGDLDGDGLGDVVYARKEFASNIRSRLSLGTGALSGPIIHTISGGFDEPQVQLFDADADGVLDLLTVRRQHLAVSPGDGAGGFTTQGPDLPIASSLGLQVVDVWDVDSDGDLDVVQGDKQTVVSTVTWRVALNDGAGGYASAAWAPAAVDSVTTLQDLVPGDYDGDGFLDAVVPVSQPLSLSGWYLQYLRGDGSTLASTLPDDLLPIPIGFGDNVSADVDRDGVDDLFLESADVARGGLAFPDATHTLTTPIGFFESLAATDVDADGDVDLLATDAAGDWMVLTYFNQSVPPGWTDLGEALAGSPGEPVLTGAGDLTAGSSTTLTLTNARANALTGVFVGFTDARLPFKGGVLVPSPDEVLLGAVTDGQGELVLSAPWLPGIGPGLHTWWQVWIADPAAPKGAAASNALVSRT